MVKGENFLFLTKKKIHSGIKAIYVGTDHQHHPKRTVCFMSVHSRSILIHLGYWYRFPFMNSKTPNFTSIWYGSVSSWKDKNDIWVQTRSNQSYFYPSLSKMRLMTSEIPWTDLKLKEKEEKQSFWSRYKFFEGIHKWRHSNFKLMRTNFLICKQAYLLNISTTDSFHIGYLSPQWLFAVMRILIKMTPCAVAHTAHT